MASAKQRANRTAFGVTFGKGRSSTDAQIKREGARLAAYRKKKTK